MKAIFLDDLTGCCNRRFLRYWIKNEIQRARRFGSEFAMILLDLDDFQAVNNSFGHLEGDHVLREFSQFLQENSREIDSVVRYGGDEFLLLLPNTSSNGALELAVRLLNNLNKKRIREHDITASIGIAMFPGDGGDLDALFSYADNGLYRAKKEGKNRIGFPSNSYPRIRIPSHLLIGRDNEVSSMSKELRSGDKAIFVSGEMGVGKTRLVVDFIKRYEKVLLLRGDSYPTLGSVSYYPFRNMFSRFFEEYATIARRSLNALSDLSRDEAVKFLPQERRTVSERSEEMDKYRLFEGVKNYVKKIAELSPGKKIFVFIDNLPWAGRESYELLDYLIRGLQGEIQILVTYRIEEVESSPLKEFLPVWARERFYRAIKLKPLKKNETSRLLELMMSTVPEGLCEFIHSRSGGNPFFIEEILKQMESERAVYLAEKGWEWNEEAEVAIPTSIEETVRRKIGSIDEESKKVLRVASVLGREFKPSLIAEAMETNEGFVLDRLDKQIRFGIIKEVTPGKFFFTEEVVRDIIYEGIPKGQLASCHQKLAEVAEKLYRNTLEDHLEEIASHFSRGTDREKALVYLRKAAKKAQDVYANDLAIKFLKCILRFEDDPQERSEAHLTMGRIFLLTGKYEEGISALKSCLKIRPKSTEAYQKLGEILREKGDFKAAVEKYRIGMRYARDREDRWGLQLEAAWTYCRLGKLKEAKERCERVLKEGSLSKEKKGYAYNILGTIYVRKGRLEKALKTYKVALRIKKSTGDKRGIGATYLDLGLVHQYLLKLEKAEEFYKKALETWEQIGYQLGIIIAYLDLGTLYSKSNNRRAEDFFRKALERTKSIGAKEIVTYIYFDLGEVYFDQSMIDEAEKYYKLACEYGEEIDFKQGIYWGCLGLGRIARERGKLEKGRRFLKKGKKIVEQLGLSNWMLHYLSEEIEYRLVRGEYNEANVLARKALSLSGNEKRPECRIMGLFLRGQVLCESGKSVQGRRFLEEALNLSRKNKDIRSTAEILYHLGADLMKKGESKEGRRMLLRSKRHFEKIGSLRFLDKIAKFLEPAFSLAGSDNRPQ